MSHRLNEIIVLKDAMTTRRAVRLAEVVRVHDSTRQSPGAALAERLAVRDAVRAVIVAHSSELVRVADKARGGYTAKGQLRDLARVADSLQATPGALLTEALTLHDALLAARTARLSEAIRVRDAASAQAAHKVRLAERIQAADRLGGALAHLLAETIRAGDAARGRAHMRGRLHDAVHVHEGITGRRAVRGGLAEVIAARDTARAMYRATAHTTEVIAVDDSLPLPRHGSAWTACLGRWAHSRYGLYPFDSCVVVDGMAYGSAEDGVYALAGGDEGVLARVETAALDFGRQLALPDAVYLAYSLKGDALLTVTHSQDGAAVQSWQYQPDRRPSEMLTTGRFVLGRGLRARHCALRLDMLGSAARIEDMYVEFGSSQRRIY